MMTERQRLTGIGYLAVCGLFHPFGNELSHHGVKGQKWGVRNGPPYPLDRNGLDKSERTDTIVMNAIRSGQVLDQINREKQSRHTKEGHTGTRSYIDGDLDFAKELYEELKGTGSPLVDEFGNWKRKERVTANGKFGIYCDPETGETVHTDGLMITYSKTGSHVYARKDDE